MKISNENKITEKAETEIIINYISVWLWHILAGIFFTGAVILVSFTSKNVSIVFFFAFFILFAFCEFMSWKRRGELNNGR